MFGALIILSFVVLALAKGFVGTEARAYTVIFIPCAIATIVGIGGVSWHLVAHLCSP